MNERLIKLMKECGIPTKHTRVDGNGHEYYTPNYEVEKFAELIVRECSYLADQAHHKATGGKSAGGYIRQHFGVEE